MLNNCKSLSMTLRVLYGSSNSSSETECLYVLQDIQFIALLPFVLKSRETKQEERDSGHCTGRGKESDATMARDISL